MTGSVFLRSSDMELHLTCSSLNNDDKLDAIGLVQGPPSLLVEVSVAEVPTMCVQQSEVVPEGKHIFKEGMLNWVSPPEKNSSSFCYTS